MRSGGLTRYAVDLMQAQKQLGHNVFAIYPENPSLFSRKIFVCDGGVCKGVFGYKIHNALLLPLLHGVKKTQPFISKNDCGLDVFRKFFRENHFDILHVHSLMGLPVSFLIAAKENGVRIVYTSHDYYGLCPKVNFINQDGTLCEGATPEKCAKCNASAKPLWYLWLRNSKLLLVVKRILKR